MDKKGNEGRGRAIVRREIRLENALSTIRERPAFACEPGRAGSVMMTKYQSDVQAFHKAMALPVGNYRSPKPLMGSTLNLRARLIDEEQNETSRALNRGDLVEVVDGLEDVLYVSLGTFDTAGIVAKPRFVELIETSIWRGWKGWNRANSHAVASACADARASVAMMYRCENAGEPFTRWDLLDELHKSIVRAFQAMGIDLRPCWDAVHANNMTKTGGPMVNGKLCKPAGYVPVDLRPVLRAQGMGSV